MKVHIRHRPHRRQLRRPALLVAGLWLVGYLLHVPVMLVAGETLGKQLLELPWRALWSVFAVLLWSEVIKGKRVE